MHGLRFMLLVTLIACTSRAALARIMTVDRSLLQSSGSERVSIYDGVLPSPDLGPRPPPPAANTTAAQPVTGYLGISHHHCGAGCITGSVIGSVVGVVLLATAGLLCWRRCRRNRNVKGERTLSQIDLLANGQMQSMPDPKVRHRTFCAGNPVFCQMGKCCASGDVIGAEGEEYRVRLFDGSEQTMKDASLAMNFKAGDSVLYTPPKGGEAIPGTIIASNGNFWPPFYQLQPKDSAASTINTTAECLQPLNPSARAR